MDSVIPASSLRPDGRREVVHPADVSGRFTRFRRWLFPLLIAVYAALPWIEIGGHPAVLIDLEHHRFYLFGGAFNAQDVWLLFFLLSGLGFALFVITSLWGRLWCGYACPQTVFLEGVFRRIERWVEGPRSVRLRRPVLRRKIAAHLLYVASAALVAHIFLSYFTSLERLWSMIGAGPAAHPLAFGTVAAVTALVYFNFAWFREQMCLVICPYGRLQSVMTDDDTLVIGYDVRRGEPRGKVSRTDAGDCIDCRRCVVVCPTGIDIRNGLQIDCIGCAACVDACDEIMGKVGRAPGLVRYDSLRGLDGQRRRFWRPRLALYAVLGAAGLIVSLFAFRSHSPLEARLLRLQGAPYQLEGDALRNSYELHVVNKGAEPIALGLEGDASDGLRIVMSSEHLTLEAGESERVIVHAFVPVDAPDPPDELVIYLRGGDLQQTVRSRFLTPRR